MAPKIDISDQINAAVAAERTAIAEEFSARLARDLESGVSSLDARAAFNFRNYFTELAGFLPWVLARGGVAPLALESKKQEAGC